MGKAITFRCESCGHKLKFYFGTGAMYPEKYQEVLTAALMGELGAELQKFLIDNPRGAIDISRVLASCESCGKHEMVRELTMYLPKENFVQEDYPLPFEFEKNYKVFAKYAHKCSYCGEPVEVFTAEEVLRRKIKLPCPNCDAEMTLKKSAPKHWN